MNRGFLCAVLIILSLMPVLPLTQSNVHGVSSQTHYGLPYVPGHDPNGALTAFNASRAQFDLYTQQSVAPPPPSTIAPAWYGGNFTGAGGSVPGTTFNVTLPTAASNSANVTWPVVNVPHGNLSSTTYLRFDWRGVIGNGTKTSYLVYNGTRVTPVFNVTKFDQKTISGGRPALTGGTSPVGCAMNDECLDVTRYIGFNLTLTFLFTSNSTGKGLSMRVSNVAIVSSDATPIGSTSHSMSFNPSDSTKVVHNDNITVSAYFANVTYHKPNTTSGLLTHTWTTNAITFFNPNSYTQVNATRNGSTVVQDGTSVLPLSLTQGSCAGFFCTSSQFISLNMTSAGNPVAKSTMVIVAGTLNLETGVQTTLGGVPTGSWGPGDLLQVKVDLRQGVNVTGSNIVSGLKGGVVQITQTFPARGGISLENFTSPLPQGTSLLGMWTLNSTFIDGYDYGYTSTTFTLEQLGVSQFAYSGNNQNLATSGTLTYGSTSTPAIGVNGYVFAVDSSSGAGPVTSSKVFPGSGMYVSNITLVNGVFTSGQSLTMTFTLVNPTGLAMNANVTIDHEWIIGSTHDSNATVPVPSGDSPFLLKSDYVYKLTANLTPAGINIVVYGLSSGNSASATLPPGNPPVTSLRQQAGIFKVTVKSVPISASSTCSPNCINFLESSPYAYVLVNPPVPGRLLASASFTSTSGGSFSAPIISGPILGATSLTFVILGRDSNGLAITVQTPAHESTLLQSSIGNVPGATENQPTTVVLHLVSNSTNVDMNIAIGLNLQGSGIVQNISGVIIPHGTSKDVTFNFNAPAKAGTYSLTFVSPDYGAPLITGTLQVSVIQSSLQVIIPAIIGLVAAIVVLLFFLFRKKPLAASEAVTKEKTSSGKPRPGTGSQPRNP